MISKATDLFKRKVLRLDRDRWNYQYTAGQWAGLAALDELSRFSVIVGYAQHLKPGGKILELGAGEGVLQQRFNPAKYSLYVATDVSDVAIANAKQFEDEKTVYEVGDINTYEPKNLFDVVIVNEAIYYGGTVQKVLDRYARCLKPDGIFIISINHDKGKNAIWHQQMDAATFRRLDRTVVTTSKNTFVITVLENVSVSDAPKTDGVVEEALSVSYKL
ncbi:class I SAM-dependent methyltransferase [Tellurirhabdus rosea]|uniref:class I SAM-dependent methyltransferase n=1 Tax=Tellurirhabdus rosea TaxID=2674997 RepID=UPI00224ED47D|nr:class I SAM-dependent methyltransferase [Tellurirhabdus rosea]